MPKNKKGGKKHKRGKNVAQTSRQLLLKEDGQEYARVSKLLGDARVRLQCEDGIERLGVIRGKMRKRVWIRQDDIVLVGLREFQDGRADVIHKYSDGEVRKMAKDGTLCGVMKDRREQDEDGKVESDDETGFAFEDI